jgi:hypothetical protein
MDEPIRDPAAHPDRSAEPLVTGGVEDAVARLIVEIASALAVFGHPWELRLDDRPRSDSVRRRVADHFSVLLHADVVVDLLLLVEELVVNAYLHTTSPRALRISRHVDGLRVEVSDGDPEFSFTRGSRDRLGGWGIPLVDELSCRWGAAVRPEGKTVWAVLDVSGGSHR